MGRTVKTTGGPHGNQILFQPINECHVSYFLEKHGPTHPSGSHRLYSVPRHSNYLQRSFVISIFTIYSTSQIPPLLVFSLSMFGVTISIIIILSHLHLHLHLHLHFSFIPLLHLSSR